MNMRAASCGDKVAESKNGTGAIWPDQSAEALFAMDCNAAYNVNRCGRAAVGTVRCTGLVACTRSRVALAEVVDDPHAWCSTPTNSGLTLAMG